MRYFYCPGRRRIIQHRCVTPLYRIPMWNFDFVIGKCGSASGFSITLCKRSHLRCQSLAICYKVNINQSFFVIYSVFVRCARRKKCLCFLFCFLPFFSIVISTRSISDPWQCNLLSNACNSTSKITIKC